MKIQRVTMAQVNVGDSICNVDDDDLLTTEAVNANYDADEQEWSLILEMTGTQVSLGEPDGEINRYPLYSFDLVTWRLCDDNGVVVNNRFPE